MCIAASKRGRGLLTVYEIEQERYALKAMRGDFARVAQMADQASAAFQATR